MTEEFGDTLRNILKKLDKLDSIEKSMNDLMNDLMVKRQKLCGLVQARIGILNFVLKKTSSGRKNKSDRSGYGCQQTPM